MIFWRVLAAGASFLFCALLGAACGCVLWVFIYPRFGPDISLLGDDLVWTATFWIEVGAVIGALFGLLAAYAVWSLLGRATKRTSVEAAPPQCDAGRDCGGGQRARGAEMILLRAIAAGAALLLFSILGVVCGHLVWRYWIPIPPYGTLIDPDMPLVFLPRPYWLLGGTVGILAGLAIAVQVWQSLGRRFSERCD